MVKRLIVKQVLTDEEIEEKEGYSFTDTDFNEIIDYDCDVYRLDGDKEILLLSFRKNVISEDICCQAYNALEKEAKIALKYIPKIQKEQSEELLKDYHEQKRNRDEVYQSNYNILSETAKQIKLPKEKGQQLVDSIMKPVRTQGGYETTMFNYMLNRVQTNPQHILQLASLIMDYDEEKGFNFDGITSKKQNTKVARNFREKLTELEKAAPISRAKGSYKSHKRDKAPYITEGEFF